MLLYMVGPLLEHCIGPWLPCVKKGYFRAGKKTMRKRTTKMMNLQMFCKYINKFQFVKTPKFRRCIKFKLY